MPNYPKRTQPQETSGLARSIDRFGQSVGRMAEEYRLFAIAFAELRREMDRAGSLPPKED